MKKQKRNKFFNDSALEALGIKGLSREEHLIIGGIDKYHCLLFLLLATSLYLGRGVYQKGKDSTNCRHFKLSDAIVNHAEFQGNTLVITEPDDVMLYLHGGKNGAFGRQLTAKKSKLQSSQT